MTYFILQSSCKAHSATENKYWHCNLKNMNEGRTKGRVKEQSYVYIQKEKSIILNLFYIYKTLPYISSELNL